MKDTINPFQRYAALGYSRLVPVIPPDAPISAGSSLYKRIGTKQDGRGKTPGIKGQEGLWFSFDWVPYEADDRDLTRWANMRAGVGVKTGRGLIAIDADTMSEQHARTIKGIVEAAMGSTPIRVGRYPKALYLARVTDPVPYQRIEFGDERVEVLSDGRFFVAEGIHPKTGRPYQWVKELVAFDDLPLLQPAQVTAMLEAMRAALPEASKVIKEGGSSEVAQSALRGDPDVIRKAVAAIPNTSALFPSRESYRDFGYAIKAAVEDEREAFDIFAEWCERWEDGDNDPGVVQADWARMKPPYRRGANWLYEQAEQHGGGQFDRAEVWFEDLENPDNPFQAIELNSKNSEAATDVYPVIDVATLLSREPPKMLVDRHLPQQSVGFLYGEPGSFKSFLTLDVALSLAASFTEWHGDALETDPDSVVVYLAAEGSYGFRNRVKAWCKARGVDPANLSKRFKMIEQTINFMEPEDIQKLMRTVRQVVGARPALVVVDTVSRALPGADENLQKDMTLFVHACDALKSAFQCAVVGVHHAGKSGDMRGSTVLRGAGDFVFRMSRRPKSQIVTLACEKQKEAPDAWEETYLVSTVDLGDGESSLVLERAELGVGPDSEMTPAVAEHVLEAMRSAWEAGEPWSKAPQTKERYAVRRMAADFGFKADDAEATLRLWEASGLIRVETVDARTKKAGFKVGVAPGQLVQSEGIFS